ncbi:Glucosamine-6-phosphate deaminase [isomerizing], alternative [hydrothermal vent metagenome]|uniref:Glucosamine-6-phosphate deaminase [isomerizing], alternative n=1 Tax=hydrothermal vent metagenome TaxID=652676 RepID=A0A3B0UUU8_9ZZZZ
MSLYTEIHEQPAVFRHSFQKNLAIVQKIAQELPLNGIHHAFIAARGTSDNAARYANYLWGGINRLPVTLATPSLFSLYQQPPTLRGALVIGISQSGQSPDIVNVVAEGKQQGQATLAITNEPESPLAQTADFVINIEAGVETAVAATKTYTTQLLAIAMLSAAWSGDQTQFDLLEKLEGWGTAVLTQDSKIQQLAERYRYMQQCVVLGRGYSYATAFEWSLKLKELTYAIAEPYSSADFRHGPIAIVEQGFPVMAIAPAGAVLADMHDLLQKLSQEKQAELLIISNDEATLALATSPISLPTDLPEWLSPLIGIIPAQLFCYHLTRIKGFNTEAPRGLNKVTKTT